MSALPRPDLPPGPARALNDALHDLHHHAGWPSLRALAVETGVSHTTVSKAFSRPRLPAWGTVELLVEAMGGDTDRFHTLWLAASTTPNGTGPSTPRIAGRRAELDVVRRHLETGTGLLLVTGEAGIGKTTLVKAAADEAQTFVAVGACHEMSVDVPLLPVAGMLRTIHEASGTTHLPDALSLCPAYVRSSLAALVPEVAETADPAIHDPFARQRLFTAISTVLTALERLQPIAVLIEDLHWADPSTFDVLDHVLDRPHPPLVVTVRTDDPRVDTNVLRRLAALHRESSPRQVRLTPLDREGTSEQLRLSLGHAPDDALVDAVHARSGGLPLFTEQLASAEPYVVSDQLADVLDARLGVLEGHDWAVVRVLGVADRPLTVDILGGAAGLEREQLVAALRSLSRSRLLGSVDDGEVVRLRHPLLAEAVRRRLVAGEARHQHDQLAAVLAQHPEAEPGEVARHWQGAGNDARELEWRLTAAEQADERLASGEAFENWRRALELWPHGDEVRHNRSLSHVLTRAIDTARKQELVDEATTLTSRIREVGAEGSDLAELLRTSGGLLWDAGRMSEGMAMLNEAVALHALLPASHAFVRCLDTRASAHLHSGRFAEARLDIDRALDVAAAIGDAQERRLLSVAAWLAMADGQLSRARELTSRAMPTGEDGDNPFAEVALAVNITDILLNLGAPAIEIDAAAGVALSVAERWNLTMRMVTLLRANVSEAHLRSGDVRGALAVLAEDTVGMPTLTTYDVQGLRVVVDTALGLLDDAQARIAALDSLPHQPQDANWAATQTLLASVQLWSGREADALERLEQAANCLLSTDNAMLAGGTVALAARAAADLEDRAAAARLRAAVADAKEDPFGSRAIGVAAPVWRLVWSAELHRLSHTDSLDEWAQSARGWDALHRPHDAAYCRWRAAQCALRDGQGTVAARLLKRAAADAREHVPLSRAIARTAAG